MDFFPIFFAGMLVIGSLGVFMGGKPSQNKEMEFWDNMNIHTWLAISLLVNAAIIMYLVLLSHK